MVATTNEIFCSYAHEDRAYIEVFRKHLRQMEREGLINSWYDGLIDPGHLWHNEIMGHLQSANIILLFISPDFLNSDSCMDEELPVALAREHDQEALVIPVILRPCDWEQAPFAYLQALPDGGKPVSTWPNRDEAFNQLVKHVRHVVQELAVPTMKCAMLNLPFHSNPIFTGREDVLEQLYCTLQQGRTTALVQAISGLGGIGKTETLVEYAYRNQDDYQQVIWLNAESRETIVADVSKLARELNTPGCYDQDQKIVQHGFLRWLERQQRWLLVLDNVEEVAMLQEYLPNALPHGRSYPLVRFPCVFPSNVFCRMVSVCLVCVLENETRLSSLRESAGFS